MSVGIAERRLENQLITRAGPSRPADVVSWLGAVQAQEYEAAKWAVGLRMPSETADGNIERAIDEGRILRTHVMRPTWHFVAHADIRWLLELTAPRVRRVLSSYDRRLELDSRTLTRGMTVIGKALRDHCYLTRTELGDRLQRHRLEMAGQRLAHLMAHAELEGLVCSGPRRGKHFTYALLEERAPGAGQLSRDEALATLSGRFFRSHSPATIRDFVWWSGLTTVDAKRGLDMIKARREEVDGLSYWMCGSTPGGAVRNRLVHLLPIYDEFLVAYRDREAVPHGPQTIPSGSGSKVRFRHALVIAGQVAGTWRTSLQARGTLLHAVPLRRLNRRELRSLADAVQSYERFLSAQVELLVG